MGGDLRPAAISSRLNELRRARQHRGFHAAIDVSHRWRHEPLGSSPASFLLVMAVAFGAPWITVVALKNIAAEVNGERSVPAFASALMWIGSGVGGILMGRVAERSASALQ